ncbi:hypothetical protein PsYK624_092020 [Phanerochaete sordida]|uniref:Uncharacterized protein n=1 Tax=Phanerochaete sordida TaxID=48140 RepID=A0A9P3LFU0_9APHY|nr:hypothetical protein PsYK624_092020 [Phanerochaete sordida]
MRHPSDRHLECRTRCVGRAPEDESLSMHVVTRFKLQAFRHGPWLATRTDRSLAVIILLLHII